MSTAGSDNVSTNPDAAVQGGFNISAGEDVELEIRKHGTLVGAAWFISPDIGVNTVTVFQVWFPRE